MVSPGKGNYRMKMKSCKNEVLNLQGMHRQKEEIQLQKTEKGRTGRYLKYLIVLHENIIYTYFRSIIIANF